MNLKFGEIALIVGGIAIPAILLILGFIPGGLSFIGDFAMNPLYRADPEREWPMLASAAYWADQ